MRAIAAPSLLCRRQPGSAIVELAVLAPVVGVLLAGLAAVAIAIQAQLGLVSVAEEAAPPPAACRW
jgi:Flp pilus assembly protein TadG